MMNSGAIRIMLCIVVAMLTTLPSVAQSEEEDYYLYKYYDEDEERYNANCDDKCSFHRLKVLTPQPMNKHHTTYLSLYEAVYNSSTSSVTCDVERRANHVEDTVEGVEQG